MRISQGEMESSLSAQMLEFPYLGDESQRLGWPSDFLRCLVKRYPEIPFWLPPFHSCLAFFILWGFQKNSTKVKKRCHGTEQGVIQKLPRGGLDPIILPSLFPSRTGLPFFSVESSLLSHIPLLPLLPFMQSIYLYICLLMSSFSWPLCGQRRPREKCERTGPQTVQVLRRRGWEEPRYRKAKVEDGVPWQVIF